MPVPRVASTVAGFDDQPPALQYSPLLFWIVRRTWLTFWSSVADPLMITGRALSTEASAGAVSTVSGAVASGGRFVIVKVTCGLEPSTFPDASRASTSVWQVQPLNVDDGVHVMLQFVDVPPGASSVAVCHTNDVPKLLPFMPVLDR